MAVLFGRTAECGRIEKVLAEARSGSSSALVVRGEAGIGKTALLQHAQERASEMQVLVTRGIESEAEIPFSGLYELLGPALGSLQRIPERQRAALRGAFGLGPPARASRFMIGAASLSLLAAHAEEAPTLIVIDDAQWIDASSADAVAFAVRRMLAEPIGVLIASRLGEPSLLDSAGLPVLELAGLDADASSALIRHQSDRAVPAETCDWLFRSTAGNPLALIELAGEVSHLGLELFDQPLAVETRVEQTFARQIGKLSDPTRRALVVVAAAGTAEMLPIAEALVYLGMDARCLEEAESAHVLRIEPGGISFRHPLMRSAAYHAVPPAERRAAHRAMAEVLKRDHQADLRAWHLGSAALGVSGEAASALAELAERAMERSAYAVAATAFARSAQLSLDSDIRAERSLAAADAAWLSGAGEQAVEYLTEAERRATRGSLRADVEHLRARIALRQQPVLVSYEILLEAAREIGPSDPAKAAQLLAEAAGDALMYAADVERMLKTARWAWDLAQGLANEEVSFFASIALGQALIFSGHGADGALHVRRGLGIMESSPTLWRNPRLVAWAARARLFLRERELGAELLQRAVDAAREQGAVGMLPVALNQIGHDSATSDRWVAARAEYEEGIRLARETGQPNELCACLAGLSRLEARQGRADACRAHAAEALALGEQFGVGLYRIWAHLALTQLELGLGHLELAIRHSESARCALLELGIADVDISAAPDAIEASVRAGRQSEVTALVEDHYERAVQKGLPWALARATRCRGLVADDASYEAFFIEALRCHRLTSDSFELGRTHLCFGERLRRARRRTRARRELRQAFEIFDELGAAPWAERARLELLATGETARRRDRDPLDRLTPQEFQIARMLAGGATTREAAANLFLSPKTVEYHLRNAYDKLGIRTRADLARAMIPDANVQPG